MRSIHIAARLALVAMLCCAASVAASTPASADKQDGSRPHNALLGKEEALPSRLATQRLLLASARAGDRLVAAGQFGHIIYSDNGGENWTQAAYVPTQVTLTSLYFVDARLGFAAGHDGTVLRTEDGGVRWTLVHRDASLQVPVLALYFEDAKHGFAVGAFSLVLETRDGGRSWQKRNLIIGDEGDAHLNAIFADIKGTIYVAAEFGEIYRSTDHGATFTRIRTSDFGSFWGGLCLRSGSCLVFGMGGSLYRSANGGTVWAKANSGTDRPIQGGTELEDGGVVLAGLQGYVGFSANGGARFTAVMRPDRQGIASVLDAGRGRIAIFGQQGVTLMPAGAENAAKAMRLGPNNAE